MSKQGYEVFLDKIRLPVTPAKFDLRIRNRNETVSLINGMEINFLKDAGLSEIEFECMLPQLPYPFAAYEGPFRDAESYLEAIERLKTGKKPFQFIVWRETPGGRRMFTTNMKVSLEEYSIVEEAANGFDVTVKIRLKQYRPFGMQTVRFEAAQDGGGAQTAVSEQPVRAESTVQTAKPITIGCEVIVNGRLHRDSYGNGPGQTRSNYRGKINFINLKGSHPYHVATPSGGWLGWVTADSVQAV